jgi:hypothetical protein
MRTLLSIFLAAFVASCSAVDVVEPAVSKCAEPIAVLSAFIVDVIDRNPGVDVEIIGGDPATVFSAAASRTFNAPLELDTVIIFTTPGQGLVSGVALSLGGCVWFFDNIPSAVVNLWRAGKVPGQQSAYRGSN